MHSDFCAGNHRSNAVIPQFFPWASPVILSFNISPAFFTKPFKLFYKNACFAFFLFTCSAAANTSSLYQITHSRDLLQRPLLSSFQYFFADRVKEMAQRNSRSTAGFGSLVIDIHLQILENMRHHLLNPDLRII